MPDIQFKYQFDYKKDESTNTETVVYLSSPKHRQVGNPHKSIWIIIPGEEFGCFKYTYENEWVVENEAWGFLLDSNDKFVLLGMGLNNEELKIAKFKKDPNTTEWHGYPCNYMANTYDVPADSVLKKWVDLHRITKAKMSKIQQALSCNL